MGKRDEGEGMLYDIPDAFLGGSAPFLRSLRLYGIRLSGLPKLLSSTGDLVYLYLERFPMTGKGHIPPDAMTTCLSVLTKLRSLDIAFLNQRSSAYPTDQCPPTLMHTVLPARVELCQEGPHGYLGPCGSS